MSVSMPDYITEKLDKMLCQHSKNKVSSLIRYKNKDDKEVFVVWLTARYELTYPVSENVIGKTFDFKCNYSPSAFLVTSKSYPAQEFPSIWFQIITDFLQDNKEEFYKIIDAERDYKLARKETT